MIEVKCDDFHLSVAAVLLVYKVALMVGDAKPITEFKFQINYSCHKMCFFPLLSITLFTEKAILLLEIDLFV